jgi:hypothetical protein
LNAVKFYSRNLQKQKSRLLGGHFVGLLESGAMTSDEPAPPPKTLLGVPHADYVKIAVP